MHNSTMPSIVHKLALLLHVSYIRRDLYYFTATGPRVKTAKEFILFLLLSEGRFLYIPEVNTILFYTIQYNTPIKQCSKPTAHRPSFGDNLLHFLCSWGGKLRSCKNISSH